MVTSLMPKHWDPLHEMEDFRSRVARLMGWPLEAGPAESSPAGWFAAADLVDEKDHLMLRMDLPGLDRKDIEVALDDDHLTIRGERKVESERKDEETGQIRFAERGFGRFERSFRLPASVDPEKVKATFSKGVLEIRLRKTSSPRSRLIEISGS
jgi:HSP20 family protein